MPTSAWPQRLLNVDSGRWRCRDADKRNAYELALLRSASMYLPNFLDDFDRLVAFDAETTRKIRHFDPCFRGRGGFGCR
jgi:hypothetical protein